RADNLASPVKEQIRNSRCIVPASYSGVSPQHVGRVSCALQLGAHPFHELAHGRNGDRVRILRCSLCTYQWREICESPVNNRITVWIAGNPCSRRWSIWSPTARNTDHNRQK